MSDQPKLSTIRRKKDGPQHWLDKHLPERPITHPAHPADPDGFRFEDLSEVVEAWGDDDSDWEDVAAARMEGYGGGARARARQFRDKDAPISFCEPSLALTDLLQHDALDTRDGESWLARKDLQRSTLQRSFACMSDVPFAEVLPCPSLRSDIDLTGRPTRVGEIPPDLDPLEREVLTLVETCRVIRCQLCGIVNSFAADLDLPPVLVGSMMHLHYEFGLENQSGAHDGQFSFSLEFQTRLRGMQNWMLRLRTFFREIWLPLSEAIHAPTRFMKLPELLLTRPFVWSAPVSAGGHGWQPFRHREVEVRELLGELRQKLLAGYIGGPICDSVRNMHRYDRKKADDFHSRVTLHGYEKAFETDETFIKEDESREAWEDYRDMTDTKFFKVNRVHFMMLMTAERDEEEVPYAMLYRLFSKKYHAPQHTAGEASTEVLLPELTELCWRRFSGRPHALLHEHRRVKARARPWDVQDAGDLPTHLAKWDSGRDHGHGYPLERSPSDSPRHGAGTLRKRGRTSSGSDSG